MGFRTGRTTALLAAVLVLVACGSSKPASSNPTGATTAPGASSASTNSASGTTAAAAATTLSTTATAATTGSSAVAGTIVVLAASSLTESFTEEGKAFQAKYPGTHVTFSFGASSTLVQQVNQGAPADVFASADTATMDKLTSASGASGTPATFATNKLEIIVEKGNPKKIAAVQDLAGSGVTTVTCSTDVPIGKYSQQVFDKAGVKVTPKSLEPDVKSIVNKVTIGEADAGIVYATDVQAVSARADGVVIPDNLNVIATYPIAVTKEAKNAAGAGAFVSFVLSPDGQAILGKYGFTKP